GPDPAGTGAGSQVRPPGLRQRYLRSNCGISAIISADVSTIELKPDRKSTRLNSSHLVISYAVFCLKKKKLVSYVYFRAGGGNYCVMYDRVRRQLLTMMDF